MWRDDHLYDLVAVVGFNDDPVVPGRGSAIFLHLARLDYLPTAGCVALAEADLRAALEQLRPGDKICIS
jgi:L,D-peptidoglycan transpeptidase YkuD (ErfK/YbiS/YcfS/YnhG family)